MLIKMCNFRDVSNNKRCQGFIDLHTNTIICACCGGTANAKDPNEVDDIQIYENWVDISNAIGGGNPENFVQKDADWAEDK